MEKKNKVFQNLLSLLGRFLGWLFLGIGRGLAGFFLNGKKWLEEKLHREVNWIHYSLGWAAFVGSIILLVTVLNWAGIKFWPIAYLGLWVVGGMTVVWPELFSSFLLKKQEKLKRWLPWFVRGIGMVVMMFVVGDLPLTLFYVLIIVVLALSAIIAVWVWKKTFPKEALKLLGWFVFLTYLPVAAWFGVAMIQNGSWYVEFKPVRTYQDLKYKEGTFVVETTYQEESNGSGTVFALENFSLLGQHKAHVVNQQLGENPDKTYRAIPCGLRLNWRSKWLQTLVFVWEVDTPSEASE
ncbi:MAG: hypothetical protein KDD62_10955 [Bdellovibrionales bacterium]|nr:hypothetical protein [Bdellovibrionales bacterium]